MTDERHNLTLAEIVEAYLQLALVPPEKPPKLVRDQRQNDAIILGYNQAQEALRSILEHHGIDEPTRALAEIRNEKQQRPMDVGGMKVWVAA